MQDAAEVDITRLAEAQRKWLFNVRRAVESERLMQLQTVSNIDSKKVDY